MVITSHINVTASSFTCTILEEKDLIPFYVIVEILYLADKNIYCNSTLVRLYNDIIIDIVYASFSEFGLNMNCCASAF